MNRRDLSVLCFKIFAVVAALRIPAWIEHFGDNWNLILGKLQGAEIQFVQTQLVFSVLSLGLTIAIAILLWRKAEYLTDKIFQTREPSDQAPVISLSRDDLLKLAFAFMGIWLLINSSASLIVLTMYLVLPHPELDASNQDWYNLQQRLRVIELLWQFGAGALLIYWQPLGRWLKGVLFFQNAEEAALPIQEISQRVLCPYCKNPLTETENVPCPKCGTLYHVNCWREHPTCGIYGCERA